MGPIVNIVFALFIFSFLWVDGGREKNYAEFTKKIGWVDPDSKLYAQGVRPGDEINAYNGYPFKGMMDHLYAPMVSGGPLTVEGTRIDHVTGERKPFEIEVEPYPHPLAQDKGRLTSGVVTPASYIIYDRFSDGAENPLLEGSPLENSGIQYGDRIVWVDGEPIYSIYQLNQIINDGRALLTIQRGDEVILRRVPRVKVQELRLDSIFREELTDWQYEADLNNEKLRNMWMVPYDLDDNAVVQGRIRFLDPETEEEVFPKHPFSSSEEALQRGDRILAIEGTPVTYSYEALLELQQNRINIIVERDQKSLETISWLDADEAFDKQVNWQDVQQIASTIGTKNQVAKAGDFVLLKPVAPQTIMEFNFPEEKRAQLMSEIEQRRSQIEEIEDPETRALALQALDEQQEKLLIGLPNVRDRTVNYNPIPTDLFADVAGEIGRTLSALFTGSLSPKYVSGPIGIVQVVQERSMVSMKEALFWVGAISLNLGILNLLPIPMLDGGSILFNIVELVTRRRISPKVMEKLIIPFAALLIGFFIFLTYNDLSRIFGGFFR